MIQIAQSPLLTVEDEHKLLCKIETAGIRRSERFLRNCAFEAEYERRTGQLPCEPWPDEDEDARFVRYLSGTATFLEGEENAE